MQIGAWMIRCARARRASDSRAAAIIAQISAGGPGPTAGGPTGRPAVAGERADASPAQGAAAAGSRPFEVVDCRCAMLERDLALTAAALAGPADPALAYVGLLRAAMLPLPRRPPTRASCRAAARAAGCPERADRPAH
ncbi:MAG: hypothetical protein U0Z44_03085 [Kouleothrix sp.]